MARDIGPKIINNDAGQALNALSTTGDDYSAAINPAGARRIGLAVTVGTSTGTTQTLDCKMEVSYDGGTTWDGMPSGANTAGTTPAALVQFDDTADVTQTEWWEVPFAGAGVRVRVFFDSGGTSPVYPITARIMRQG